MAVIHEVFALESRAIGANKQFEIRVKFSPFAQDSNVKSSNYVV